MFSQRTHGSKKVLLLPWILLLVAVIACTVQAGVLQPTQSSNAGSDKSVSEHDLAAEHEITNPEGSGPLPTNSNLNCQESLLAGLVFGYDIKNEEALWQFGSCGGLVQLSNPSDVKISPDGAKALFTKDQDIWIVDLSTGEQQNLTQTPDRLEMDPQWWLDHEDLVIFSSWGSEDDLGPSAGFVSMISTDGSDYRVLTDQPSNANPSPQPAGTLIAYDLGDTAWLYKLDTGESEEFDVGLYGLNIEKGMKIGSPSWSPDGKKLTWWVGGVFSPSVDGSVALAVFDLEGGSVELLHPYTPVGSGGWIPAPVWSPDGKWLAAVTRSEGHRVDLWVIRVDDGQERLLGFASNPVWKPDSSALVYQSWPDESVKLMEIAGWKMQTLDLPSGSIHVDWLDRIWDFPNVSQPVTSEDGSSFGPQIHFAISPDPAESQQVFPYGTTEIFAIWPYRNMLEGLSIRREWYRDGEIWLVREEPWDYQKYGINGVVTDISVYDFDQGLEPGRYQLRLFIDAQEQKLGFGEQFSTAFFEISEPVGLSPQVSPDFSQMAIVEPPGTLIIQEVESQEQRTLITVEEISSLGWFPDGSHILFSVRNRSSKGAISNPSGYLDELWIINLITGEVYPFQDQFGNDSGMDLHHPYISPDGRFVAAISGSGWTNACYVDSSLWVKEISFSEDRLREVYSYFQSDFTINLSPENSEMYVKRIIGWDSPVHLKVELGWTCTGEGLDGIYMLDMSDMTAVKIVSP